MSNSLLDILQSKNFDEPAEATSIKRYVDEKYHQSVAVTIRDKDITITAQGAAFVGALRMQSRDIQRAAATDKRLVFRIA